MTITPEVGSLECFECLLESLQDISKNTINIRCSRYDIVKFLSIFLLSVKLVHELNFSKSSKDPMQIQ